MGIRIEDGGGRNGDARVAPTGRLDVSARSNTRSYYVSRDDGLTFALNSHDATAAAGTYIAYWKNTDSARNFVVDLMRVGAVETALWKIWFVTGTAAGGNVITPTNMRSSSGKPANATARGDDSITGLSTAGQIASVRTPVTASMDVPFADTLQIGPGDAVAVEYDAGTTGIAEVLIRGFYDDPEA